MLCLSIRIVKTLRTCIALALQSWYVLSLALYVADKAGVQPRPPANPADTDFDLQPYVALVCRCDGPHPHNPYKYIYYYSFAYQEGMEGWVGFFCKLSLLIILCSAVSKNIFTVSYCMHVHISSLSRYTHHCVFMGWALGICWGMVLWEWLQFDSHESPSIDWLRNNWLRCINWSQGSILASAWNKRSSSFCFAFFSVESEGGCV